MTDEILGPIEVGIESDACLEPFLESAENTERSVPSEIIRLVGDDHIG